MNDTNESFETISRELVKALAAADQDIRFAIESEYQPVIWQLIDEDERALVDVAGFVCGLLDLRAGRPVNDDELHIDD